MTIMGYRNADRVYDMARRGVFSTPNPRFNSLTLQDSWMNMMMYMALHSIDAEDEKALTARKPYWVYYGGLTRMAIDFGLTLTPVEVNDQHMEEKVEARAKSSVTRLSRIKRGLERAGALKELQQSSNIGRVRNATLLLLLGDDAENAAAEAWARECLNLPEE